MFINNGYFEVECFQHICTNLPVHVANIIFLFILFILGLFSSSLFFSLPHINIGLGDLKEIPKRILWIIYGSKIFSSSSNFHLIISVIPSPVSTDTKRTLSDPEIEFYVTRFTSQNLTQFLMMIKWTTVYSAKILRYHTKTHTKTDTETDIW